MILIEKKSLFEIKKLSSKYNKLYKSFIFSATAIHTRKYLVSSDPRSQAGNGAVSTAVGDHAGILRAVVFVEKRVIGVKNCWGILPLL